jgi:regulator of cell morphogenesis and NO signaling
MHDFHSMTVREIALEMPITTRVFEEYKIDYCCHGNTLFDEACKDAGAEPGVVIEKIDGIIAKLGNREHQWEADATLGELIDHILDKHHVYTRAEIEQLTPLMAKVASRHGGHHGYLFELEELFTSLCAELTPHMMKEENVLFPYICRLEDDLSKQIQGSLPPFGTVQHPIRMMRIEHDKAGDLLKQMRVLTSDYALPDDACPSFSALYSRLAEFEADLHQHIHLENNLLFPRAVELEQKTFPLALE